MRPLTREPTNETLDETPNKRTDEGTDERTAGKDINQANECIRNLKPRNFDKDKFVIRSRCRLLPFDHAADLIMVLPGKKARIARCKYARIITRHYAGDMSLLAENSIAS
jgi:hypothetical protein